MTLGRSCFVLNPSCNSWHNSTVGCWCCRSSADDVELSRRSASSTPLSDNIQRPHHTSLTHRWQYTLGLYTTTTSHVTSSLTHRWQYTLGLYTTTTSHVTHVTHSSWNQTLWKQMNVTRRSPSTPLSDNIQRTHMTRHTSLTHSLVVKSK